MYGCMCLCKSMYVEVCVCISCRYVDSNRAPWRCCLSATRGGSRDLVVKRVISRFISTLKGILIGLMVLMTLQDNYTQ